jgi:threonine dehydrogenase-like Zn-dependent dehydrogenase
MSTALDLMASRRVSLEPLITDQFGLADVDAAFNLMDSPNLAFVKGVVRPEG